MVAVGTAPRRLRDAPGPLRQVDWVLVGIPIALAGIGILMIYSSTRVRLANQGLSELFYVQRQSLALVLGLAAMAGVMLVDYRRLRDHAAFVYATAIVALVAVIFLGTAVAGSPRWFALGPMQFQPSELAKIAVVLALAAYCHQHRGDLDASRLGIAVALAAVPTVLVQLQPDLGTALVMGVGAFAVLLVAGIRGQHLAILVLVGLTGIVGVVTTGQLESYQVDRLTGFLSQTDADVTAQTRELYSLNQSKIAIASGGLTGKGLFQGTQTQLGFVPEQHTDFIFTAVGEELGLLGAASVLALLGLLAWRVWRTALVAADLFGTLVCIGVLAIIVFQTFENVGMTMGIMPITGLPLPFVSYGGSSLIALLIGVGLVANVQMRRFS